MLWHSALALLFLCVAALPQEGPSLREHLEAIDFSDGSVGVADVKKHKAGDSDSVAIFKGFKLTSADGCTITLRNEGRNQKGEYVYEAIVPLAELRPAGDLDTTFTPGTVEDPHDFGDLLVTFATSDGRPSIKLAGSGAGGKRLSVRGSRVQFGFFEREAAERFLEKFGDAVRRCAARH